MTRKELLKKAFIDTIPVMAGYLVLGMGFGVLLATKGFGPLWAVPMAVTIFSGSLQYVAINLIGSGASLLATALTSLLVNARYLFYAFSMIGRFSRLSGLRKFYVIFGITDEAYSLQCVEGDKLPEELRGSYYFHVTLFDHSYWIAGCLIGSVLGSVLHFNAKGMDFSMTALFLTILVDQWRAQKRHSAAVIGIAVTALCLIVFGPENFLIPAMAGIIALLALLRRREEAYYG